MSKPLSEYERVEKKYGSPVMDSANNGPRERVFYLADGRVITERLATKNWMSSVTMPEEAS